jgi:DNA-binding GntR family transcriptional regulator
MSPGATFERVYLALKDQLLSGRFEPGRRLEPALMCDELNASITPVRDALHRLVGERLVSAPRHDGFHAPLLTEAALRDLYRWSEELLLLALKRRSPAPAAEQHSRVTSGRTTAAETAALFEAIGAASENREHLAAIRSLNDRLHAVRLAEARILSGAEEELAALGDAFAPADLRPLRHLLGAYHRRRVRHVAQLLAEVADTR